MDKYDHKKIEKKWQKKWEDAHAFATSEDSKKEKLYVLDMFPYPSGAGLHVGHVEGYTATDIYSRYKRAQGYNVLHPMGWDAFGLPAENYAIKTGTPPRKTTDQSIANFKSQIKNLGLSYDWSREFGTHNPEYYKWTQWLFLKFYEKGLVYKKKALVNWDPIDQTVLANEQVLPDGTAERSGAKVEKKDLEQWFYKITDYADELIEGLDTVDWPESTKINQRNWIGRSEGAEIDFEVKGLGEKIKIFTTRPDTLYGATYMVLAPEHPIVKVLAEKSSNKDEILAYAALSQKKSDIERSAEGKEKTGVEIKCTVAINPATKKEIPLYIADYVLGGYGTGAIMAVPAHDERDFAFAQKFNLPIVEVIEPETGQKLPDEQLRSSIVAIVEDPKTKKFLTLNWGPKLGGTLFIGGGREEGESAEETARREIAEETGYTNLQFVGQTGRAYHHYFAFSKNVARNIEVVGLHFTLAGIEQVKTAHQADEKDNFSLEWLTKDELFRKMEDENHLLCFKRLVDGEIYSGHGILAESGAFSGLASEDAKQKITESVGGKMVKTYRLRDWLISRQRYWGAPIPVVYDPEGKAHPVPEEHLPWTLPEDVEYLPKGTSPLGTSKELLERTEKIFGKGWKPEIDTMDTFACSSWYYFRFADSNNTEEFASKEALKKWLPVDLYLGGAEHTVLHLLYARFFTKALRDMGYLTFNEPFLKLRHQGLILAEDSRKMSKRWGNVINPDDMVERFGADSVRLYEMFMGPLEASKPWNTNNIMGVRRFIERVWKLEVSTAVADGPQPEQLHKTIKKVGEDIENLKLNTAVSSLMILLNYISVLERVPYNDYKIFLQLLTPFAPHLTSELAERSNIPVDELTLWPTFDSSKIVATSVEIAVQVGGKVRGSISISPTASQDEAVEAARGVAAILKWLPEGALQEGKGGVKVIYVPGRILSFVLSTGA